jgi:hypothetical protein
LFDRYEVDQPSDDDRMRYLHALFESLLSFQMEESRSKSKDQKSSVDLPKAPKEVDGPKLSELKAKAEAEQHAVRRMRMCLRDICNRSAIHSFVEFHICSNFVSLFSPFIAVSTVVSFYSSAKEQYSFIYILQKHRLVYTHDHF